MTSIKDLKKRGAFGHKWSETGRLRLDMRVMRFFADYFRHYAQTGAKVREPFDTANDTRKQQSQTQADEWQRRAEALWVQPQHANKGKYDIARLIDADQANTIRRRIRKP